jgi:starch phosphorylase
MTLGTMDGANVEIVSEVGEDNAVIFGLSSDEVIKYENEGGYDPMYIFNNDQDVREVLMELINGKYSPEDPEMFRDIYNSLLNNQGGRRADTYFILKDFRSYADAQKRIEEKYTKNNGKDWARSVMINVANAGKFSSDRTIEEYVSDIWKLEKVHVPNA